MSNFFLNSQSTIGQTLDGNESGFVTAGGAVIPETGSAVTTSMGTNTLVNSGSIFTFSAASPIDANGDVFELLNTSTGIITGETSFLPVIDADLTGRLAINNQGLIHATNGNTINLAASDAGAEFSLNNSGAISTSQSTAITASLGNGFFYILNTGDITSQLTSVRLTADLSSASLNLFTNTGLISSTTAAAVNVSIGEASSFRLLNSGEITAFANTIQVEATRATDVTVVNTGLVESRGGVDAVSLGEGEDVIRNSGTIIGNVDLGDSNDIFVGLGGTVSGVIFGGAGDDFFNVDQTDVSIDGGAGLDTVNTRADFTSQGGVERIILLGSDDLNIIGDEDANLILGNIGDNDVIAGLGNDTVRSGNGDDTISGGGGADILQGGAGEDVLEGGTGRDDLFGGLGRDVFVFTNVADSGIGGVFRDRIHDFEVGVDLIDLSELSDPSFTFQGTGPLSGSGPSVAFSEVGPGFTIVRADVDGDGAQDFQILVLNTPVLTASDFLL